jgi:hypothetical protein
MVPNIQPFDGFERYLSALVWIFLIERKRGNFVLSKADFADVAGGYGEKSQRCSG